MKMRESLIMVPQKDNDGQSLEPVLQDTMKQLLATFGGCTVVEARGAWTSQDGQLYIEPVNQVISAYVPSPEHDAKLRQIAWDMGVASNQLAVYVRYASGEVEIVSVLEKRAAA